MRALAPTSADMSLLQPRSVLHRSLSAAQRTAATQAKPVAKAAQTVGGVAKGRKERWETKMRQEATHRSYDISIFTKLSEDRLRTPKQGEQPARMPAVFQPGASHSLQLPLFSPNTAVAENIGTVAAFDMSPATAFGLPEKMFLEFRVLSQPCSVIRDITIETVNKIDQAKDSSSKDSRIVLTGSAGCGKSFLLHQAVQHAKAQGWMVFYVPRAATLVNSSSRHTYDLRTQTYLQPAKSYRCVDRFFRANSASLSQIPMQTPLSDITEKLTSDLPPNPTLSDLAQLLLNGKATANAPVVLAVLMKELEMQTRFPVLMAVDDMQSLFQESTYKDPFFKAIQAHHLSVPRILLEFASGKRFFKRGAFIGALTASDTMYPIPLELHDILALPYIHPTSPYTPRSPIHLEYAKGLQAVRVPEKLSVREAAALFDVWKRDLALVSERYDELFLSKYTESDGNARQFVWKGLLSTFSP